MNDCELGTEAATGCEMDGVRASWNDDVDERRSGDAASSYGESAGSVGLAPNKRRCDFVRLRLNNAPRPAGGLAAPRPFVSRSMRSSSASATSGVAHSSSTSSPGARPLREDRSERPAKPLPLSCELVDDLERFGSGRWPAGDDNGRSLPERFEPAEDEGETEMIGPPAMVGCNVAPGDDAADDVLASALAVPTDLARFLESHLVSFLVPSGAYAAGFAPTDARIAFELLWSGCCELTASSRLRARDGDPDEREDEADGVERAWLADARTERERSSAGGCGGGGDPSLRMLIVLGQRADRL